MVDIENCRLVHYPSEIIGSKALPIEEIDESIVQLAERMSDIMVANKGIGLAGPQANAALRIFVISLDAKKENVRVYINPTVTPSGELEPMEEGCLSVPGVYTKIRRYERCSVTATDLNGKEFTEEAEGLYARCLQHEYDHINGITIAERMGTTAKIAHRRQLKKLKEKHETCEE